MMKQVYINLVIFHLFLKIKQKKNERLPIMVTKTMSQAKCNMPINMLYTTIEKEKSEDIVNGPNFLNEILS